MKLPRIGCTIDPEGKMIWAWTHPDNVIFPTGVFDAFPPFSTDPDGNLIEVGFAPDHTIMYLNEHLHHQEMGEVITKHRDIRWRKNPDGSWRLRLLLTDGMTGEPLELDHPLNVLLERRRK